MTDASESLDAHLAALPSTSFEVTSKSSAAWAAAVIARNDRKLRESEQTMNDRIRMIGEWFDQEKQRLDTSYLRDHLIRYHRGLVADELAAGVNPDRVQKSLPLPDGVTVERRKARTSVEVSDVDLLPPGCVASVPVPVNAAIRRLLEAGEMVEGARLKLTEGADPDGYTWNVRVAAAKNEEDD